MRDIIELIYVFNFKERKAGFNQRHFVNYLFETNALAKASSRKINVNMSSCRSKALLFFILSLSFESLANDECEHAVFEKNCDLIHRVVQVTSEDPSKEDPQKPEEHHRQTQEEYADSNELKRSVVREAFKATGILTCNEKSETAQLTGKNNVLTFAAHIFYNRADCSRSNPIQCTFALDESSEKVPVDLAPSSLKLGGCGSIASAKDWGTAKLTKPIIGVKPYDIPSDDDPPQLRYGQLVIQSSGPQDNFIVNGRHPKSVEKCFIKDNGLVFGQRSVKTDCNTGRGSSGAAQFVVEESTRKYVLGAINVAEYVTKKPGTGYDVHQLHNSSVELRGEFLKAVRENLKP